MDLAIGEDLFMYTATSFDPLKRRKIYNTVLDHRIRNPSCSNDLECDCSYEAPTLGCGLYVSLSTICSLIRFRTRAHSMFLTS